MHVLQLLRIPGQQQLPGQPVVAILHHTRHGDVDISAWLYKRQQLLIQVAFVPAKVIVGIHTHYSIEKFLREGEREGIRFHCLQLLRLHSLGSEESVVFLRVAPQIGGIDLKAVFLRQEQGSESIAAAQITDPCPLFDQIPVHQFLCQLHRVWPHNHGHELVPAVFFASGVLDFRLLAFTYFPGTFLQTAYKNLHVLFQASGKLCRRTAAVIKADQGVYRRIEFQSQKSGALVSKAGFHHLPHQILHISQRAGAQILLVKDVHFRISVPLQTQHFAEFRSKTVFRPVDKLGQRISAELLKVRAFVALRHIFKQILRHLKAFCVFIVFFFHPLHNAVKYGPLVLVVLIQCPFCDAQFSGNHTYRNRLITVSGKQIQSSKENPLFCIHF